MTALKESNYKYIPTNNISNNGIVLRGRGHEYDITGLKFGRLSVNYRSDTKVGGHTMWDCTCDCGTEHFLARSLLLRHGNTRSCGCLQKEKASIKHGDAIRNTIFANYQRSAKKRNIEFKLTKEQFLSLIERDCHYCNKTPSQIINKVANGIIKYNGVDRVDNSKGYEIGNVVACCKICNRAKDVMSEDEFLDWIRSVYIHSVVGELV
jgi:hypothetical protein